MTGARPRRRGNWSVQELERLKLLVPRRGVESAAGLLRRSPDSVRRKALELMRSPPRRGPWTADDDDRLRASWGAVDARLLGPMLGRSTQEVRRRAQELSKTRVTGAWRPEERRRLKQLYGTRSDEDLELCLGRAREDILSEAVRFRLAKDKRFVAASPEASRRTRMPRWTSDEVARLRELYPRLDNLAVARELDRTVTSVANKANQLGLRKSPELLADIGRNNIAQRYARRRSGDASAASGA